MNKSKWVRVSAWTMWKPHAIGEVLEGVYTGARTCDGVYGPFTSVGIRCASGQRLMVTAVMAVDLLRNSGIATGTHVRLTWTGTAVTDAGNEMHTYALDVCEGAP